MKKVLAVDLTTGRLTQTNGLDGSDLSLYGSVGKSPIGDGTGRLDASWMPDAGGQIASAIGLPTPQYDSDWVTLNAGSELVLNHDLGAQPALFLITYKDNFSSTIEKVLPISNGVGVWRQRVTAAQFLLYTSWSWVGWNDAGQGLTLAPIRVRAWRSGPVSGGGGGILTVVEEDGGPSVTNVTEIRVPNGSLTDLGGGKVLLTVQAASGSGGLDNPMLAAGDLIVGGAAALVNQALISLGATASSPDPVYQSNVPLYAIDGDDTTGWLAPTTATTTLTVDLGQPRNISAYRVVQTSEGHKRSYIIESSEDQQNWATRVTSLPNVLLNTGVVALTATVLDRYWRITLIGPSANTGYGSGLQTFELLGGAIAGTPTRLAGGSERSVLTMVNGTPGWATAAGGGALFPAWQDAALVWKTGTTPITLDAAGSRQRYLHVGTTVIVEAVLRANSTAPSGMFLISGLPQPAALPAGSALGQMVGTARFHNENSWYREFAVYAGWIGDGATDLRIFQYDDYQRLTSDVSVNDSLHLVLVYETTVAAAMATIGEYDIAFHAHLSAAQNFAHAAEQYVNFDTADWNAGGYFTVVGGVGRWTPPAGPVEVGAYLTPRNNWNDSYVSAFTIWKNGAAWHAAMTGKEQTFGFKRDVATGTDYYEVRWVQYSGGQRTLNPGNGTQTPFFFGRLLASSGAGGSSAQDAVGGKLYLFDTYY